MSKELKEGYPGREVPKSEEVTTLPVEDKSGACKKAAAKQAESSYFSEEENCGECDK